MEIIDKRAEKRAAEAAAPMEPEVFAAALGEAMEAAASTDKVVEFKKTVRGEKQGWKSTGYVVAILPVGQAQIFMVRAVGMRTDEKVFTADYAIPPVWEDGVDFAAEARKRLDTFKACSCDRSGPCKFHGAALPSPVGPGEWLKADMERLGKIQSAALPECVEVLMKAEAARQQNRIVLPGRG
jgi:hypothetical protein